jgi:riboflavin biosynthesis pyrimidine reductase
MGAGLVDELRLFVYPAIQGRGRGLVDESISVYGLSPLEVRSFRGGVTLLRYSVG